MVARSSIQPTLRHWWVEAKELAETWASYIAIGVWVAVWWTLMVAGCLVLASWCGLTAPVHFDGG